MSQSSPPSPSQGRIMSVDVLRGFDMFWIIGGKGFFLAFLSLFIHPLPEKLQYHFTHVEWVGFSAWDLIMPLFLFIVGVSMAFSFRKRLESGANLAGLYKKILRRVLILFVLGMIAQGNLLHFDLSQLHIYCNTLQAIAVGYLVTSICALHLRFAGQIVVTILLLVGFCLLMMFVPVPGHGAGVLKPDANLALFIDDFILRGFSDGTPYTWILSSMGFAATTLMGLFGGYVLREKRSHLWKLTWLVALGAVCLLLGWAWGLFFPIIKHIWSSSMVLWAAGWSYWALALFYLIIDVAGFRKWSFPFMVIGMNAIVAYVAPHVLPYDALYQFLFGGILEPMERFGVFLLEGLGFMTVWGALYFMYRKKIFVRI